MHDKFCLPIIAENATAVRQAIEQHEADYGRFEVWLDYASDVEAEFVRELAERYPGRIIVVFRREKLAPMQMPQIRRIEVMRAVSGLNVWVDLDVHSQQAEFEVISDEKLRLSVIGSYHNYELTPDDAELRKLAAQIAESGADVIKIATQCRNESDAVRLLGLQLELKSQGQKHEILGMGPHGLVTRVFGALWGNEFIFAPEAVSEASAPGQLTRAQLEAIFANLG